MIHIELVALKYLWGRSIRLRVIMYKENALGVIKKSHDSEVDGRSISQVNKNA